jgi:hypothetical protein
VPIVYVHGVANRLDDDDLLPGWDEISTYLRRYVAPEISEKPETVAIEYAYWGEYGAKFRWDGISRPRTKLLAQGAGGTPSVQEQLSDLADMDQLPARPERSVQQGGLTSGQSRPGLAGGKVRLRDLTPDQLSDFLSDIIDKIQGAVGAQQGKMLADQLAHDEQIQVRLAGAADLPAELEILRNELAARTSTAGALVSQGPSSGWGAVLDRVSEVIVRVDSAPSFALSRLAMEVRGPLNQAVTTFFGDVFEYMAQRKDSPGTIRNAVLEVFRSAKAASADQGEPFIVLSHSMGGQVVIDLAAHFIEPDLRIDFWAAAASQVGLFEELKLLLASDPAVRGPNGRAAFPPNVGWWWNVWDSNDILSFTAHSIFGLQVDDEEWNSGASLAAAHGAYLRRPSFYRRLAAKIRVAKEQHFNRP